MADILEDIIKFREDLSDKQKYLERTQNMRKPNAEMEASPSETLTDVLRQLDMLIGKHVLNSVIEPKSVFHYNIPSVSWRACNNEFIRRLSLSRWIIV